jgi:hypothetical protein
VSSPVIAALVNARAQEQAAEERALTAKVWAHLGMQAPQGDASEWPTWQQWCERTAIPSCPAVPASIAVFILKNAALGDRLEKVVESIGAVHQADGKADPTLSPVVIAALYPKGPPIAAPRSWNRSHSYMWQILPRAIQDYIVKRQDDHDKEIRRLQREYSDMRKEILNADSIKEPTATTSTGTDAGADRDKTPDRSGGSREAGRCTPA